MLLATLLLSSLLAHAAQPNPCDQVIQKPRKQYSIPTDIETQIEYGNATTTLVPGEQIRLLVWNIQKAGHKDFLNDLHELNAQANLAIIQESMIGQSYCQEFGNLDWNWQSARSFWYKDGDATGVSTASHFINLSSEFLRSQDHEPVTKTPKMTLITRIPIAESDNSLLVVNVHGINFVSLKAFLRQMDDIYEKIKDHQGPLIWAGDFNTYTSSRKKHLDKITSELGLNSVPLENDHRKLKLDHVFQRGFVVDKAQILTDRKSSDHFPLWLDLSLQ